MDRSIYAPAGAAAGDHAVAAVEDKPGCVSELDDIFLIKKKMVNLKESAERYCCFLA